MMPPDQDAFGTALHDWLIGRPSASTLLMEFDNGVTTSALPPEWFFQPPEQWDPPEHLVLSAVTSGPVLDLGAGAGRHSLLMQDRGLKVTALDISPAAIDVCHGRGVRDARVGSLAEPPTDQRWGAVLLMCGNFGLAGGWHETRDLLVRLAEICADDAVIVADSVDPTDTPGEQAATRPGNDVERDDDLGVVTLRLKYGQLVSPWTKLLNVAIVEVASLVEGTGWYVERHERQGIDHYVVLRRPGQATRSLRRARDLPTRR